ncbi:MAG TPA: NFACT family protein [Blastocatellia bacterium]|nr:NFACT family protein [Blastocatellia bacterium]
MDNFYLSALVRELQAEVQGRTVSRLSLEASTILIDLGLTSDHWLLVSLDRAAPALYLSDQGAHAPIQKRQAVFFLSLLRRHILGARLTKLWKDPLDRIIQLEFEKLDAADTNVRTSLRLSLTGRSANAWLADAQGNLLGMFYEQPASDRSQAAAVHSLESLESVLHDSMTQSEVLERFFGADSIFGPQFKAEFLARCKVTNPASSFRSLVHDLCNRDPLPLVYSRLPLEQVRQTVINTRTDLLLSHIELAQAAKLLRFQFSKLSEAADQYYRSRRRAIALRAEHSKLKQMLAREINRRESTLKLIQSDRVRFEHPENLKRYGDLILANIARARTDQTTVTVVDYYDPDQAEIQIEIPKGATLTEAASNYFARYQKARRALAAIDLREREISHNVDPLRRLLLRLEHEPTADCIAEVSKSAEQLLGISKGNLRENEKRAGAKSGGTLGRRFRSSDGYEIIVGRNDRDNDALTFRVARPNDIWLHAADYPGSHAIIRNPKRDAPPHRTITEAAELAAFYSQAKRENKAAVHYALKKFVSKPPRSRPGLVRLSSFKTILVEPRCKLERLG